MIHTHTARVQLSHLLSLIPVGVAIGFLLGVLEAPSLKISDVASLLVAIGTAVLYGVAIYLSQSIKTTMWLGYIHMASAIALFTIGVANALYIIILASGVAVFIQHQTTRPSTNHPQSY